MMGNRGSPDGIEVDAFDRSARSLLSWSRGELRKIKRAFSKRQRRSAKREVADG